MSARNRNGILGNGASFLCRVISGGSGVLSVVRFSVCWNISWTSSSFLLSLWIHSLKMLDDDNFRWESLVENCWFSLLFSELFFIHPWDWQSSYVTSSESWRFQLFSSKISYCGKPSMGSKKKTPLQLKALEDFYSGIFSCQLFWCLFVWDAFSYSIYRDILVHYLVFGPLFVTTLFVKLILLIYYFEEISSHACHFLRPPKTDGMSYFIKTVSLRIM